MSAANSAAKKRRVPTSMEQPSIQQQLPPQQQQQQSSGYTLPQVISLLDSRLLNLEKNISSKSDMTPESEYINEFETRFEILAEEISSLKQIVLSLQSYTMDVNKVLMEERLKSVN
jgi:hypothetical protein